MIAAMKSTLRQTTHTHAHLLQGCVAFFALILSTLLCSAQSPTPCPDHNPGFQEPEPLAPEFQPSAYDTDDTTVMYHIKFKPPGTGQWPTVLMLPPAVFKNGYATGTPKERVATRDLVDAGFLVFQIEHRLAPDGLLEGQHQHDTSPEGIASGRPPQQTDDVKQQILAALADPDCNGTIFLIGGSSGGCHALWVALDPTSGNIADWNSDVVAKIKGVVSLSGVTDLGSREHDADEDINEFIIGIENYTNTALLLGMEAYNIQEAVSPITLVANAAHIPPVLLYATEDDSVPHQQAENMRTALQAKGADVTEYTMPGNAHCFNYWHMINTVSIPTDCVSNQVIAFLNAHVNDP